MAKVGEHVCPNTLFLGGGKAGQIVAGPNLASTAQMITMIQSFTLGQSQPVPFLIPIAKASVNLPFIHAACNQILVLVDLQLDSTKTLRGFCVDVLNMWHYLEALVHLHLLDCVSHSSKWSIFHELLPHNFSSDHDVGVAESVLRVDGDASASLHHQVPQAPAAEEHDEEAQPRRHVAPEVPPRFCGAEGSRCFVRLTLFSLPNSPRAATACLSVCLSVSSHCPSLSPAGLGSAAFARQDGASLRARQVRGSQQLRGAMPS